MTWINQPFIYDHKYGELKAENTQNTSEIIKRKTTKHLYNKAV